MFLGTIEAEGTSTLTASGTGGNLVNASGILVYANSTAAAGRTYVDSTENNTAANMTASATTLVTGNTLVFLPGDVIFIDENNDATWDPASEELMVVLLDSGANLTVSRGAFGTTAVAYSADTMNIYRLNTAVMTTAAGIVGNAMTVLDTKLTLALSPTAPSGAATTVSDGVVFAFTASAANNSADPAANTATLTYVDITTTESSASINDLTLYPSDFDTNSTYATTCGGLTTSKWRCTLSSVGNTNQIDENTSRTYIVRGDTAYSANGSINISIATLGTSSVSTNSVYWTDGTTAQYWVNQASTYVQSVSPLSSVAASGTVDATAPTISAIAVTGLSGGTANTIEAGDVIAVTYSEVIDPTTINASLVPGGSVTGVAAASTGGFNVAQATAIVTLTGITTFDSGASITEAIAHTVDLALDTTGKILTITISTISTGTGTHAITTPALAAGTQVATTVKDVNAVASAAVASAVPTGAF